MANITTSEIIPATCQKAFEFLTDPANLPGLLKPSFSVEIGHCAAEMRKDAEFNFKFTRFGIEQPVRWRIENVVPGKSITFRQIEGSFKKWLHTTQFESRDEGRCLVTDLLEYQMPFGLLGHLVDDLYSRRDLSQCLSHRLKQAAAHFSQETKPQVKRPTKLANMPETKARK